MQPFRICCWALATKIGHYMLYQTTKKSLDNVQNRRKVNINNETYRYSKLNNCSPTTITLYWRNLNYIIVYNNRQTSNYKWYGFFFLFLLFRLFSFLFFVWIKWERERVREKIRGKCVSISSVFFLSVTALQITINENEMKRGVYLHNRSVRSLDTILEWVSWVVYWLL